MLFTLSTTQEPATDLGYLLHKNPNRLHEVNIAQGKALLFYPEAHEARCTFAMTLDIDAVSLVRGSINSQAGGLLDQYVNDRPYAMSSFMTVAMGRALGTAFTGRSKERQAVADAPLPLEIVLTPLPVRGAEDLPTRLFAPLGYTVQVEKHALLPNKPEWGDSYYVTLTLNITESLQTVLEHLYVLIPVLDNRKHYYIDKRELEKLMHRGEAWLKTHPDKELITYRYLKNRKQLVSEALARLVDEPVTAERETDEGHADRQESYLEKPLNVNEQRLETVTQTLLAAEAQRVLDLGCGEGRLLKRLLMEKQLTRLVGVDVSITALERAASRLKLDTMTERQRSRIELLQGSSTYRDSRFNGFDAIALVEVIEHLELDRLPALERVIFEYARPKTVIVTTPNRDYNAKFANLADGKLRHADHRFEWTRTEFATWCTQVAERFGYQVNIQPIGALDPELGSVTQMGVFSL